MGNMDCPRCSSENKEDDQFCWMCGWDFSKTLQICDRCGLELKKDNECSVCGDPTAGWISPDEDND